MRHLINVNPSLLHVKSDVLFRWDFLAGYQANLLSKYQVANDE